MYHKDSLIQIFRNEGSLGYMQTQNYFTMLILPELAVPHNY